MWTNFERVHKCKKSSCLWTFLWINQKIGSQSFSSSQIGSWTELTPWPISWTHDQKIIRSCCPQRALKQFRVNQSMQRMEHWRRRSLSGKICWCSWQLTKEGFLPTCKRHLSHLVPRSFKRNQFIPLGKCTNENPQWTKSLSGDFCWCFQHWCDCSCGHFAVALSSGP